MTRVDAGQPLVAIARELGTSLKTIQRITGYLAPTAPGDRWEAAAARSSEWLLAAIAHHHPELVRL